MRWLRGLAVAVLALALTTGVSWAAPVTTYYLSLGDSLAAGYQPGAGETSHGYADLAYAALKRSHPGLTLQKLGCTGETSSSLLGTSVCRSRYPDGNSQLAAAVAFLQQHRGHVPYLSIDIGANDVSPCVTVDAGTLDLGCAATALTTVVRNLARILDRLHAADPTVLRSVGVTYYDPFLAVALAGKTDLASRTLQLEQALNLVETGLYGRYGYRVADMATAFHSAQTSSSRVVPGHGSQPLNVAYVCTYTFSCSRGDVHPTDAGYQLMANTLLPQFTG